MWRSTANQSGDQSWAVRLVRLVVYVVIALAVAYAIAHFWTPHFGLR
jgi:hypothetical protein